MLDNTARVGFGTEKAEICQISAKHKDAVFNAYSLPLKKMSQEAENVTGLKIIRGEMFSGNEKLSTTPIKTVFENFLIYLKSFNSPIILIAHNGFRFDFPIILRYLFQYKMMEQFKKTVVGFADTLTIFKNFLTKRQEEKQSFKVEDLARDFLGPEFTEGLHNAAQDIKILSTLIDKINVPNDKIISMAKSTPFILADRALKKYFKGAVTSVIASKIALGRINLTTLKKAFQLGGYDSVKMLLAENINNKPRVTKK
ncbi:hypothetical protein ILUMI_04056 [Ignelater luminosus]|uniref:Exuperantia RNAse H-like domain-containing protein n=1 Tax=Ignelater luminosus TaxID=2038154 RepID=A0A8K0D9T9_IGNLU|nr:hypothetical protein ILUMI_04056 [Ignelater luminosus]